MAFKEVTSLDADTTISLGGSNKKTGKANPKQIEGFYLGSKQVNSPKSKNGKAYIHILQTPKGNVGVWGKTDLDRKLTSVDPGTMVRVTQSGMQSTPNGDMYKFKVEVDADNTIEVDLAANDVGQDDTSSEEAYEASSYSSEDEDEGYIASEEQEAPAKTTAKTAQAPEAAADRQRRVQAMFKNRKAN